MGERICSIPVCGRKARSRGMCNRHYENVRRYGEAIPQRDRPLERRLQDVGWTVTDSGCWDWDGRRNEDGYGTFSAERLGFRDARAHRVVYEHLVGPIPSDAVLRHSCDNPPCVNPAHLQPGTQADNVADMVERERHRSYAHQTRCPKGHDLTSPQAIRTVKHGQKIENLCAVCDRDRKNVWQRAKRATHRDTWSATVHTPATPHRPEERT